MKQTPLYELYSRLAPKVEDWPVLMTQLGELLRRDYDWSAEVPGLAMPVMIVAGDADGLSPAHCVEFFGLLGMLLAAPVAAILRMLLNLYVIEPEMRRRKEAAATANGAAEPATDEIESAWRKVS